jgi:hypothetical protein
MRKIAISVSSLIQKVRKSFCCGSLTISSPLAFAEELFHLGFLKKKDF